MKKSSSFNRMLDNVIYILSHYSKSRDSDEILCFYYYSYYYIDDIKQYSLYDYLSDIKNKKIPSLDTISRARRKAQELHKELRGLKYHERQNKQKEVKHNLGYDQ